MKRYLVVFRLPQARLEHASLKKDLERYSGGDLTVAFESVNKEKVSLIGYLFATEAPISELTFDRHLFREDACLVLELGDRARGEQFSGPLAWLRQFRAPR